MFVVNSKFNLASNLVMNRFLQYCRTPLNLCASCHCFLCSCDNVIWLVDVEVKQVMIYKNWFSDAGADCKLIDGDKLAEFFCGRGGFAGRICTCTILHNCIFKILLQVWYTTRHINLFKICIRIFSYNLQTQKIPRKNLQAEREGVGLQWE